MKKTILTTVFSIIVALVSIAQTSNTYSKVIYYNNDSVNSNEHIMAVEKCGSNLYMAMTVWGLNGWEVYVLKTDLQGNLLKKTALPAGLHSGINSNSMILDRDTNVIICGAITGFVWSSILIKLNSDLDTVWTRMHTLPDTLSGCPAGVNCENNFMSLVETPDGNYMVSGNYEKDCVINNFRSYLVKYDKNGNLLWQKTYPSMVQNYDIAVGPDSGFVVPNFINGVTITKLDKDGNVQWERPVNNNNHKFTNFAAVAITSDSNIVFVGNHVYNQITPYIYQTGIYVSIYDHDGIKITEKKYTPFKKFEYFPYDNYEVILTKSDKIIIINTAFVVNPLDTMLTNYKGILFKLNSQADSLWMRYYSIRHFSDYFRFSDVVLMNDGGFLAAGHHNPWWGTNTRASFLVRTDSMGFAPGEYTVGTSEMQQTEAKVQVYPNPALDELTVDIGKFLPQGQKYCLSLYNTAMQKIKDLNVSGSPAKLDIRSLDSGVYLYRIDSREKIIVTGKFIKL